MNAKQEGKAFVCTTCCIVNAQVTRSAVCVSCGSGVVPVLAIAWAEWALQQQQKARLTRCLGKPPMRRYPLSTCRVVARQGGDGVLQVVQQRLQAAQVAHHLRIIGLAQPAGLHVDINLQGCASPCLASIFICCALEAQIRLLRILCSATVPGTAATKAWLRWLHACRAQVLALLCLAF